MMLRTSGLDVNGLFDRGLRLSWPDRSGTPVRELARPKVIAGDGQGGAPVTGAAARLHPAGRGWQQPAWAAGASGRFAVSALLPSGSVPGGIGALERMKLLGAHLRHLAGREDRVGLAVDDDSGADAQEALFAAVGKASRFDLARGARTLTAEPVWRSVAAAFAWGAGLGPADLAALAGGARRVRVLSLLYDRMTLSELVLDAEEAGGLWLLTPERQRDGVRLAGGNPAARAEEALCDRLPADLAVQVRALGAEAGTGAGASPETLFQDATGRWRLPPVLDRPRDVGAEMRFLSDDDSGARSLGLEACLAGLGADDVLLVETPDPDRPLHGATLARLVTTCLTKARARLGQPPAILLPADAVARGAAEYLARVKAGLPTFYDRLPQLEIAAHRSDAEIFADEEERRFAFITLFAEETRVPGNAVFRQTLAGKFAVPAGGRELTFHLWKMEENATVRVSHTVLPVVPAADVSVDLIVTQRPVGGHASIVVVPKVAAALGVSDPVLDWQRMTDSGQDREAVLRQLEAESPYIYPHCAPLPTALPLWTISRGREPPAIQTRLRLFLATPPGTSAYSQAVDDLVTSLRQTRAPKAHGLSDEPRPLYPFASDGTLPDEVRIAGIGGPAEIVATLREKIDRDARLLPRDSFAFGRLVLAGTWMHAAVPSAILTALRDHMRGLRVASASSEGIGRTISAEEDIRSVFDWISRRILEKVETRRIRVPDTKEPWVGTSEDLKGAALLLQYRRAAGRLLTERQALILVRCAIGLLSQELDRSANGKVPQQVFLWSVRALLLVLRYRQMDPTFLSPDAESPESRALYAEARTRLAAAGRAVVGDDQDGGTGGTGQEAGARPRTLARRPARASKAHPLIPGIVTAALDYIDRQGRTPGVVKEIAAISGV